MDEGNQPGDLATSGGPREEEKLPQTSRFCDGYVSSNACLVMPSCDFPGVIDFFEIFGISSLNLNDLE